MQAAPLKHHTFRLHPALKALSGLLLTACAAWWLMFGWLVFHAPLPYAAMDFNHDGNVSFSEAEYATNYGTRTIQHNNRACLEYFSLKDGLPLATHCPPKQ